MSWYAASVRRGPLMRAAAAAAACFTLLVSVAILADAGTTTLQPASYNYDRSPTNVQGAGAISTAARVLSQSLTRLTTVRWTTTSRRADFLAAEGDGEDVYAFGNASGPSGARLSDFGLSSPDETVGPYSPRSPTEEIPGASTTTDPLGSGLTGHYHRLPAGTDLPEGLGIHADGADVGGLGPAGHRTIYPTAPMSYGEFQGLFQGLPWEWAGKI